MQNKDHMNSSQSNLRNHICPQEGCTRSYKNAFSLQRHIMAHDQSVKQVFSNGNKIECPQLGCEKSYDTLSHLRRHIRIIHEKTEIRKSKGIKCEMPDCKKKFYNRCSMQRHIKTKHLPTKPATYNCDQCNKVFGSKNQLKTHYIIHTGKMHKCKHCPGFPYTPHFRPDNPTQIVFPCTEENCLKFYHHETNLITHFHTRHTPTYGFECDLCGKRFWEKRYVKKHLNKHMRKANGIKLSRKSNSIISQSLDNLPTPEMVICDGLTSQILKLETIEIKTETTSSISPKAKKFKQEPMENENSAGFEMSTDDLVCMPDFIKIEPLVDINVSDDDTPIAKDQVCSPNFIKVKSSVNIKPSNKDTSIVEEILCTPHSIKLEPLLEATVSEDDTHIVEEILCTPNIMILEQFEDENNKIDEVW